MQYPTLATASSLALLMALGNPGLASTEFNELCDSEGPRSESEIAAVSNVQLHRGPLDRDGARIVGCLHNPGDDELRNLMLGYSWIQTRGSGGGNANLEFEPIPPGQSRPFQSTQLHSDRERYERWGISGAVVNQLEVFNAGDYALDPEIELPHPLIDRPAHPIEAECAALTADQDEGPVLIRHAELAELGPRVAVVIGCVTNTGEDTLATGRQTGIEAVYELRTERGGMGGGSGWLQLDEPLEPGASAFFISSFTIRPGDVRLTITPGGMRMVDGEFALVSDGPDVSLERSAD